MNENLFPQARRAAPLALGLALCLAGAAAPAQEPPKAAPAAEAGPQIEVAAKIYQVPADRRKKLGNTSALVSALSMAVEANGAMQQLPPPEGASLLSAPRVIAGSGKRAVVSVGRDVAVTGAGGAHPSRFEGLSLEVLPTWRPQEGTILLAVDLSLREAPPGATEPVPASAIRERRITTTVSVRPGQTVLLGGAKEQGHDDTLMVAVTATPVPEAGAKPGR